MLPVTHYEYLLATSFYILQSLLGFFGSLVAIPIYRSLVRREEVSMVSFLLHVDKTAKEFKILQLACAINFIGFFATCVVGFSSFPD